VATAVTAAIGAQEPDAHTSPAATLTARITTEVSAARCSRAVRWGRHAHPMSGRALSPPAAAVPYVVLLKRGAD